MNHVVIVESPTKAKTIAKFLPKEYDVIASVGHVRDLPRSAADIPAKYKDQEWSRLGINVENDFEPLYVTIKGKSKIISDIKKKLEKADSLILATDEDREGESIAKHIVELVKPRVPVKRMVFHEITKDAIHEALGSFRSIDENLVKAQEARRILDRLFGYKLSNLLWKKIAYRMSSGRVQSPGLRLLVERERERSAFVKATYGSVDAIFEKDGSEFEAKLASLTDKNKEEKRIAVGSDFDSFGALTKKNAVRLSEDDAKRIAAELAGEKFTISSIEEKPTSVSPPIPFTTSTLQQEGNKKLHLSARETMRAAQSLYEQGFITYMRTDSPTLSMQAIQAARSYIGSHFSKAHLPEKPRIISAKSKNAQEAHEAIRPAGTEFTEPSRTGLSGRELQLYTLIWQRTVASQMASAQKSTTSVALNAKNYTFNASGSVLVFGGFLDIYSFSKVEEKSLPAGLKETMSLAASSLTPEMHETKPPGRYNDASLVKQLEALGIGRPSTYATIINTLLERGYARRQDQMLVPTLMGFAVTQFLENNFQDYVNYNFTANMEDELDDIANGDKDSLAYLKNFYFGDDGLVHRVEQGESINSEVSRHISLPQLDKKYEVRVGRYGPFVLITNGEEKENFSIPEDCNPSDINKDYIEQLAAVKRQGPQSLGKDPESGKDVYCLTGRYGPYVQLGAVTEEEPKPKRAPVPREINPVTVDLATALKLLSLPKTLGAHPENGEPVVVSKGRFGPYISCGSATKSIGKDDDVYTITLARAVELLAQPSQRRRGSAVLKDLGVDTKGKKAVKILNGPYGAYIKYGTKNIRIPDERKEKASEITLEEALALCAAAAKK